MARTTSERLRRTLVADIRARGVLSSARVEAAFLAVAQEHFLPEVLADGGLNAVYRDDAIVTKRNGQGLPLSSSSQPSLMAKMLELLDVPPGGQCSRSAPERATTQRCWRTSPDPRAG